MFVPAQMYWRGELNGSDHKPVHAVFKMRVKKVDSVRKRTVMQEIQETVSCGSF